MLGGPCRGSSLVPGAAKYCKLLQTLQPQMMIVDEAMEILEAHIVARLSTSALLGTGSRAAHPGCIVTSAGGIPSTQGFGIPPRRQALPTPPVPGEWLHWEPAHQPQTIPIANAAASTITLGLTGHGKAAAGGAWGEPAHLQSIPASQSSPKYLKIQAYGKIGVCSHCLIHWCCQPEPGCQEVPASKEPSLLDALL